MWRPSSLPLSPKSDMRIEGGLMLCFFIYLIYKIFCSYIIRQFQYMAKLWISDKGHFNE